MKSSTVENEHVLLRDRQFHRRNCARCRRLTNRAQISWQVRTSPRPGSDVVRSATTHGRRAVVKHGQRISVGKIIGDFHLFNVLARVMADLRALRHSVGRDEQTKAFSDWSLPSSWNWRRALSPLLPRSVSNNSTCSRSKYRLRLAALLHWWRARGLFIGDMRWTTFLASPLHQHLRCARIRIGDRCLSGIRGHVRVCLVLFCSRAQLAGIHSFQWTDAGLSTYPHRIAFASLNDSFVASGNASTVFKLETSTDS